MGWDRDNCKLVKRVHQLMTNMFDRELTARDNRYVAGRTGQIFPASFANFTFLLALRRIVGDN